MPIFVEAALMVLFPGLLSYAAAMDLLTMTIPNRVSIGLLAGFCVFAPVTAMPLAEVGMHLAIALGALIVCFGLFSLGFIGGGDAKLLAAVALWFGWPALMPFIVMTALYGGILAAALLALRRVPLPAGFARMQWLVRLHTAGEGTPYGLAIAAGALTVYPQTQWMAFAG
jgi:prepilin peptidase CpaA